MDAKTDTKSEAAPVPGMDVLPPKPTETTAAANPVAPAPPADDGLKTPPAEDGDTPEQLINDKPSKPAPVQKAPKPQHDKTYSFTSTVIMVLLMVMAALSAIAIFAYTKSK